MAGAVRLHGKLAPIRGNSVADLERHRTDLERRLLQLEQRLDAVQGHTGTPTFVNHVDLSGNRVTNVGPTRSDRDAPNVAELRTHAMYAKEGKHEAEYLIVAKRGIRTFTPAKDPDDLVPLRQLKALIFSTTGAYPGAAAASSQNFTTNVTQLTFGLAYPQRALTLVNGANGSVAIADAIFVRVSGPTGAFSIGGFPGFSDGRVIILYVAVAQTLTLLNEDLAVPADERILTGTGADLTMDGPGTTQLIYSLADHRWISL